MPEWCHRLRKIREDRLLSQENIGKVLGTSQSYYAQYENGKREITFSRIMILAEFYGVSLDYFAGLISLDQADKKE